MAFIETPSFPLQISAGAIGGPNYSTDIVVLGSGHESRNQNWQDARGRWDVASVIKNDADRRALLAFFRTVKGRAIGFRFQDPLDYQVAASEGVFEDLGDDDYQLVKRYSNAAGNVDRAIAKPVDGTIRVYNGVSLLVEDTDYEIDYATGIVSMLIGAPPPAPTSWIGKFEVPCRFDTDGLRPSHRTKGVFVWESIPIVEIRDIA